MKTKLVAALLLVLLVVGMASALADSGGWGEWIIDPRTGEEVFSCAAGLGRRRAWG